MKRTALVAAAALLGCLPAIAQQSQTSPSMGSGSMGSSSMNSGMMGQNVDARTFVQMATAGNEFEIQSSRMAEQKASNAEVKRFARQMVNDHTKAGEKMRRTLSQANIDLPTQSTQAQKLDASKQTMLDQMKNLSGAQFDQAYIQGQVTAHQEAVNLYRMYSQNGENQQLKQFASDTLPTLEQHLQHAQKLQRPERS